MRKAGDFCETCAYFHEFDASIAVGQCRWRPPAPVWADVDKGDWCGEYDAAEVVDPEPEPPVATYGGVTLAGAITGSGEALISVAPAPVETRGSVSLKGWLGGSGTASVEAPEPEEPAAEYAGSSFADTLTSEGYARIVKAVESTGRASLKGLLSGHGAGGVQ